MQVSANVRIRLIVISLLASIIVQNHYALIRSSYKIQYHVRIDFNCHIEIVLNKLSTFPKAVKITQHEINTSLMEH